MKTDDKTLIAALRILAEDDGIEPTIQSHLIQAADRLEELTADTSATDSIKPPDGAGDGYEMLTDGELLIPGDQFWCWDAWKPTGSYGQHVGDGCTADYYRRKKAQP